MEVSERALTAMNLADLIDSDDPELGPAAGLQAVDLLASAGHYVRRAPRIFNLDERTVVGAKYREDLDTRTQHYPALYRAVFDGASVTGQGTVITRNSTLIHDSCWEMLAQNVVPDGLERLPDGILALKDAPARRIERPSLLLKRPWWRSYRHWLVDSAALLALVPGLAMPRDWQIVIGRYDEPRMRQIVYEALGFLAPGVPVLEHWDHETWTFDELHYTTPVSNPPLFKLPQAIAALRALVLSSYPSRSGRRKLYVSRGSDNARRLENEEEIISLCVAAGFEVVRPEDYPLRQQAQLFNSAEIIVGAKGAALTNLLFCNSSAAVIVLSPSSWAESFYWDIAGQIGIKYIEVMGNPTAASESSATPPFAIDTGLVAQALADAGTSQTPKQLITELGASDRRTIAQDAPHAANDLPVPAVPKAAVAHKVDSYEDAPVAEYQAALPVTDTAQLDDIVRSPGLLADRMPSADPLQGMVLAHLHDIGDVEARLGDWIGSRGSGLWIEGIQITLQSGIARNEIEYQVVNGVDRLSSWVQGGEFCGTRGMSLAIRGLSVRLRGAAADKYECACSAAFADGTERNLVATGDVCAASSFAPLEDFQIILRPRLAPLLDARQSQSRLSPNELMLQFESLGDNCEFGLVQRHFGAEPLGLLRFAGFYIPVEKRLRALVDAIQVRFEGLGQPGTIRVDIEGPDEEYIVRETVYDLMYHTFLNRKDIGIDQVRQMEEKRLSLLRRKFENDLQNPRRILVWKSNVGTSSDEIRTLYRLLSGFGPHVLLWVSERTEGCGVGEVEVIEEGLLRGYVERFAPYSDATNIDYEPWLALCRNAYQLVRLRSGKPRDESVILPKDTYFHSRLASSITVTVDVGRLKDEPFSRAVLAPAGTLDMPGCYVMNPPSPQRVIGGGWGDPNDPLLTWDRGCDEVFPRQLRYPEMWVARLDDACYLPYAPPFFPDRKILINDFLIPWAPHALGWFEYQGGDAYKFPFELTEARCIDTGFYMGHSVSGHFGHFIADCLSRMHAWRLCRQLFGDVKLILEHSTTDTGFRESLLMAAGVNSQDIVFAREFIRCRKLLLASPALGVQQYASSTSAELWPYIRDTFGSPQGGRSERIYLSRSGQAERKLRNEPEVEDLFRSFGFQIVRPEDLPIEEQVSTVSAAELIAGPGGSGMYNLAFQKRLKSVFIMTPDTFIQITEWLFLAGTQCAVYYHVGSSDVPMRSPATVKDPWRVDVSRLAADIKTWLSRVS